MRTLVTLLAVLVPLSMLAGCGATVLGENKDGIWFREPYAGGWDMQSEATEHCAKFGKKAVRAGVLDPTQGYALPVVAYNCE
ncbi:MAG: hypothetical protein IPK78_15215 [Rhodospirillales bacterium]|nr:hypothetical protein [Rhodospirillales bacterium]